MRHIIRSDNEKNNKTILYKEMNEIFNEVINIRKDKIPKELLIIKIISVVFEENLLHIQQQIDTQNSIY